MHSDSSTSPPTRASLKAWWNHFTFNQKAKKQSEPRNMPDAAVHPVFGKSLGESLKHASVQISTANANGELYVWGYIPVVVAKCGLYLKENATDITGIFRVNGSARRMRELQAAFEAPPRYGKSLDWSKETYTTHDVASVFRRYLTQMPEPVIPHNMYHPFRDILVQESHSQDEIIAKYKRLIRELPQPNQYLLLYVLDLLSVFVRKSDKNLMTATNLAVIFRPGLISHPSHEMTPSEHALSQRVLEFLIAQQDWFMLDIPTPLIKKPEVPPHTSAEIDDTALVPNSDEETSGGWKLVGRDSPKIPRLKITSGHSDIRGTLTEEDMSPVAEGSSEQVGVTRRRTLPSSRRGGEASDGPFSQERSRVLRKQKRASSSQPSQTRNPEKPLS